MVPPCVCSSLHLSGLPRRSVSASLSAATAVSSASLHRRSSACCASNRTCACSFSRCAASNPFARTPHSAFSLRAFSDPSFCFAAVFSLFASSPDRLDTSPTCASYSTCACTTASTA
eukprot:4919597-Prymnesium_polylepis.1